MKKAEGDGDDEQSNLQPNTQMPLGHREHK